MTKRTVTTSIIALMLGLFIPGILSAQRGSITIPQGASISVPLGAVICADTIFANGSGHGTLTLADPSCLCSGSVVIPVEMLTFSAVLQDGVVFLSWVTATETRNYGFEIQRKTDHHDWRSIGFVEGHGSTTQPNTYRFTDECEDLPSYCCRLRYRLKQIDTDGRYEHSPEVEVRLNHVPPVFALKGYPSPCDEAYTIRLSLTETGPASIRLHDAAGRIVMLIAQDAAFPAGSHSMLIRTSAVPSGLYLLVAETEEGRRTEKVMVQH